MNYGNKNVVGVNKFNIDVERKTGYYIRNGVLCDSDRKYDNKSTFEILNVEKKVLHYDDFLTTRTVSLLLIDTMQKFKKYSYGDGKAYNTYLLAVDEQFATYFA